ncbi:carboxymuconolactone decarboxylase family protein [Nocardioides humilatus]|uniref:Carboxymuconolactone decarboxylase family protein n=1 Tax=Nocardioides humilatus TaxID=2607660 RepID=A0A5B1L749_9ACTN|nr:carboxymuconolactone decarboxylase family protein [Nocardioides humilatus]KAA1416365.1 carboxymuconolactone decarboxylase family protein [Nocardioides humilatus]
MSTEPRVAPGTWRQTGPFVAAFAYAAGRVAGTESPAVFRTLGRNRGLFWGWLHFAGRMMPGGRLPRRESELLILRVATACGSDYELAQHRTLARRAGLTKDEIARVEAGGLDGWDPADRTLLAAADELLATEDLSDDGWAALVADHDERTAIEIVMIVAHYRMLATALRTFRVQPDRPRS